MDQIFDKNLPLIKQSQKPIRKVNFYKLVGRLETSQHRALTSLGPKELTKPTDVIEKLGLDKSGNKVGNRHRIYKENGVIK